MKANAVDPDCRKKMGRFRVPEQRVGRKKLELDWESKQFPVEVHGPDYVRDNTQKIYLF